MNDPFNAMGGAMNAAMLGAFLGSQMDELRRERAARRSREGMISVEQHNKDIDELSEDAIQRIRRVSRNWQDYAAELEARVIATEQKLAEQSQLIKNYEARVAYLEEVKKKLAKVYQSLRITSANQGALQLLCSKLIKEIESAGDVDRFPLIDLEERRKIVTKAIENFAYAEDALDLTVAPDIDIGAPRDLPVDLPNKPLPPLNRL